MTDRRTASTINDLELDALYDQVARTEAALRDVLACLYPLTRAHDQTPLGYQAIHPIPAAHVDRWQAVLDGGTAVIGSETMTA